MSASNFHDASSTKKASDVDANSVHTPKVILAATPTAGAATLPSGATPLAGNSGNVAAASAVATLSNGADGTTVYLCGFRLDGLGATSAAVVQVAITGLLGGTVNIQFSVPAGATVAITPLVVEFERPWPASAINTDVIVTVPSFGTGNTKAQAAAHGFRA